MDRNALNVLIEDFRKICAHFGKPWIITVSNDYVKIIQEDVKKEFVFEIIKANKNCGLTCVYGAQSLSSLLSNKKNLTDEQIEIIMDLTMTIVEVAALLNHNTNIINWSLAINSTSAGAPFMKLLERRKKMGVVMQIVSTDFKNKNSSNTQIIANVFKNPADLPLDENSFMMITTNAMTSKRCIDLSKYEPFIPFWHKFKVEQLFKNGNNIIQFETRKENVCTFQVVNSALEAELGKTVTITYNNSSSEIKPLNPIELAKMEKEIEAELVKNEMKNKSARILKECVKITGSIKPDTRNLVNTLAELEEGSVYGYVPNGAWSNTVFMWSNGLFMDIAIQNSYGEKQFPNILGKIIKLGTMEEMSKKAA
jgi:hypothetical protein